MKKLKPFLFASCLLGGICLSSIILADEQTAAITKTSYDANSKTFEVMATKTGNGKNIKQVDVAIWSEEDGQDDIKWYSTSSISNGQAKIQFNLGYHENRAGNYNTHVYTTYSDGSKSGAVLDRTKISVQAPQLSIQNAAIKMEASVLAPSNGNILYAIWSEQDGQDDIRWYSESGTGTTLAELRNHLDYGKYNVHTYLDQDGKLTGVSAQDIDIAKPDISYQILSTSDKTYDILVNNVPEYMTSIVIPVWSEVNNQDDIRWYRAEKIAANTYKLSINLTNHGFDFGNYAVHIYGQNGLTNKFEGLGTTTGFVASTISGLERPLVSVTNGGSDNGLFTVDVLETRMSKRIKELNLQVISKTDNQKRGYYVSKTSSYGKIRQTVDLKTINSAQDTFTVSATVVYSDNTTDYFNLAEQVWNPQKQSNSVGTPKITAYINETNTYPAGQCTWAVKALAPWIPNWLGNANGWATNAKSKGFQVGRMAKVGSIIVWPNDGGGYGHVAYVTHVESNTRIQVKEANYAGRQYISNFRGWFNPLDSFWGGNVYYIYPD